MNHDRLLIVLDADKCLYKASEQMRSATLAACAKLGYLMTVDFHELHCVHSGKKRICDIIFETGGPRIATQDFEREYLIAYDQELKCNPPIPTPGVREALEACKREGHALAVVTNNYSRLTIKNLKAVGLLSIFDEERILGAPEVTSLLNIRLGRQLEIFEVLKPNVVMLEMLAELTGIPPQQTYMIGDQLSDIRFAINHGAHAIGIRFHTAADIDAIPEGDFAVLGASVIHDFTELPKLIGVPLPPQSADRITSEAAAFIPG
jgi:phosphoglycolate phosphatase-like HAD superfamily hydrolase